MIIDAHCHAGLGDRLTTPASTAARLGTYFRRARAAGIDRTVVLPAFHSDYEVANAQLARLVRRAGGRLIGFAMVHPVRDAGRVLGMVRRAVTEWGFRGVKVHGHDALPTREVCEAARVLRVPVLVDVFGKAEVIDLFAPEYPDVPFIVPHFGSFADDWRVYQRVIDQMVRHPNVFGDTSGVRQFDYLVQAVRRAGPAKVIFGSDGPWLHPALELHKIRLLGLSRDVEAAVLGGNILRLMSGRWCGTKPGVRPQQMPAASSSCCEVRELM
jgi:predicted TIM-barrel fold metal-dependent hydrolase